MKTKDVMIGSFAQRQWTSSDAKSFVAPLASIYIGLLLIAYILGNELVFRSYEFQFWLLSFIIALHNFGELIYLFRSGIKRFFLQPVVLGAIVLFLLQLGGVTNFLLRDERGDFYTLYNEKLVAEPRWLAFSMALVLGCSVAYWTGYKLSMGHMIYKSYFRWYRKFWNFRASHVKLLLGLLIGWMIKLTINSYDALGHKMILLIERQGSLPPFITRLKVFENLSLMFTIVFMYLYYQNRDNKLYRNIFFAAVIFELVFAITSGARFAVIAVALGIFSVDYFFKNRVKFKGLLMIAGVVYFALTFLTAYKEFLFRGDRQAYELSNPIESIQEAVKYNESKFIDPALKETLAKNAYYSTVGRFNYVNEIGQIILYKNKVGLGSDDPDFVTPMFTFPFFAVLPKYYLFGIEEPAYGKWATELLGGDSTLTSTAISPVAYSYLSGGAAMAGLIFLILGVLMRTGGLLLAEVRTAMGFILFMGIAQHLIMFDSVVHASFLNLIRYGILLPPLLWIIVRKY